jgi:hypothetical protein
MGACLICWRVDGNGFETWVFACSGIGVGAVPPVFMSTDGVFVLTSAGPLES